MRTSHASLVGLVALLVALVGPMGAMASAAPDQDDLDAARAGAGWMAAQLDAGLPLSNFGSPDWGVTLDAALGLASAEVGADQLDAVWNGIVAERETIVTDPAGDVPGRLARVILLGQALGHDVRSVGAAPGADLVARLAATMQLDGADAGLYGTQFPLYDAAFRQGYSMAALQAAGESVPAAAVEWLLAQQCDDGSWMPYRSDLSAASAFDADLYVGPDSNSTAAALDGLAAAGAGADAIDAALDWFDAVQRADGGWSFYPGTDSDPNSTAMVIQALLATQASEDARFADQADTAYGALRSFQLGCDTDPLDQGAFTYPGSNGAPNLFATAQASAALSGATVIIGQVDPSATVPGLDCDSTTTTTTTSSTSTTTTAVPATTEPAPSSTAAPVDVLGVADTAGTNTAATNTGSTGATTAAAGQLAATGSNPIGLVSLGAALVVLGLLAAWRSRELG